MFKKAGIVFLFVVSGGFVFIAIYLHIRNSSSDYAVKMITTTNSYVQKPRTKISGCQVKGMLPDLDCTPGAIIHAVSKEQVCTGGYASSVRSVSNSVKNQVYAEYGILSHTADQYEVDHLVSLELGGSNDIANLWPEVSDPTSGFHQKDKYENYLHTQVCGGVMSLSEAQYKISTDWYRNMKVDTFVP